jgi:hypothetical protein
MKCNTHGKNDKCIHFFRKPHLTVDRWMILKLILKKQGVTELNRPKIWSNSGTLWTRRWTFGFHKISEFLDLTNKHQLCHAVTRLALFWKTFPFLPRKIKPVLNSDVKSIQRVVFILQGQIKVLERHILTLRPPPGLNITEIRWAVSGIKHAKCH